MNFINKLILSKFSLKTSNNLISNLKTQLKKICTQYNHCFASEIIECITIMTLKKPIRENNLRNYFKDSFRKI